MRHSTKSVRLEDLAKIAGVSTATVSRALNGSTLISEATRERIMRIAREHRYDVRPVLRGQEDTPFIAKLVVPEPEARNTGIDDPFVLDLIAGISEALAQLQGDLLLSHASPATYDDLRALFGPTGADPVIFIGQSGLHDAFNRLAKEAYPFVVWGGRKANQRYCTIGGDNRRSAYLACQHLLQQGRRRVAFFGQTDAVEVSQRLDGYKLALQEAGIAFDPELVRPAHFFLESAVDAVDGLLGQKVHFDAAFCASDMIALGVIRGLHRCALQVPQDVAVVGYDDIRLARYASPALTTIRQDVTLAGRMIVSKLQRLQAGEAIQSELLPTELLVRDSSVTRAE